MLDHQRPLAWGLSTYSRPTEAAVIGEREKEREITQTSDFTLAVSERCPVSSTTFLLSGMSEGYMKGSVKGSCGTF